MFQGEIYSIQLLQLEAQLVELRYLLLFLLSGYFLLAEPATVPSLVRSSVSDNLGDVSTLLRFEAAEPAPDLLGSFLTGDADLSLSNSESEMTVSLLSSSVVIAGTTP